MEETEEAHVVCVHAPSHTLAHLSLWPLLQQLAAFRCDLTTPSLSCFKAPCILSQSLCHHPLGHL